MILESDSMPFIEGEDSPVRVIDDYVANLKLEELGFNRFPGQNDEIE